MSINNGKYYISSHGSAPASGYGNSGLRITSYTLTGTAPDGVLKIVYQNKNILKGAIGPVSISRNINLYFEGAPGAILRCRSLSSSTTDIWTRGTSTDTNNIFYNGGVRAGDETQTTTCNSITEGTQRYNKTLHAIEYCSASGSPLVYSWTLVGAKAIFTTINEVNNGGGSPCVNACDGIATSLAEWMSSCAGRYCRALGYHGGVGQEYNCAIGIYAANSALVACF